MIILSSTSDVIRIVTSHAALVEVHASYVDLNGTTVTPGRTNTIINTAATTTVVAAPGASTVRNLKHLNVYFLPLLSQLVGVFYTLRPAHLRNMN